MDLNTQQEWLIHKSVNVFEWPSQSLGLNPVKYFYWNRKMYFCPHPTWDLERWRGEATNDKQNTWGRKGASAKYSVKDTYAMYLWIFFFVINLQSCDNSIFALSIWWMECRLVYKKHKFKAVNIRQQHNKTWKKLYIYIHYIYIHTTVCHYIIYIYIYIYIYSHGQKYWHPC